MKVPTLQELCLIKLAVTFWASANLRKHMKQANGFFEMENALRSLKELVGTLPMVGNLRKSLIGILERVGYQIHVLMNRPPMNDLQKEFDLGTYIKWDTFGAINEKLSCDAYILQDKSKLPWNFKWASVVCDEENVKTIWGQLSSDERGRLGKNNLLVSYWVHILEDKLDEFVLTFGYFILGFDPYRSLDYNMTMHCINSNFKPATAYFFNRLTPSEKQLLTDDTEENFYLALFKKLVKNPREEHFKYICSFLEMPLADSSLLAVIAKEMPNKALEDFICFLLRQVNAFGDLHYNLFRRLVGMADKGIKMKLISKMDFFVLNLLAKGRFETFEHLLTKNAKLILRQQLSHRLKQSKGLASFFTICRNNQTNLLKKCFKYVSTSTADERFFSSNLKEIVNGF